ncbi:PRTRC system protein B [Deinococcus gobiensis]|uniref:PRTRC system protein B n=1 Tax=Deinococcus gobiensis (strain DSM 21396 / JCM 16679 / CGMCC 1.7299 / I-0) TaxID=745776 RepID=H8H198_DEIGI|nr:PRTRC system protein B [Deinococcus gobiensis]AFD27295.1 hypothetical protein DGo_PB0026 [Deinococcus gobiensis I-0]
MPATIDIEPAPTVRPERSPVLLRPVRALVLYTGQQDLVLHHPVQDAQGQPILGPASPLSAEARQGIIQTLGGGQLTPTFENTLAVSPLAVAWWRRPGPQSLLFNPAYAETRSIAALTGLPIPLPGLVFVATPGTLRVYACQGDERPTLDAPLFHAPLWNTFSSGQVCRGTTQYPNSCTPATQSDWEQAFFHSEFTHPSRTDRFMAWGHSYEELLRAALTAGAFPQDVLLPVGKTLGKVLE